MDRDPFLDVEPFFDLTQVSFSDLFKGAEYVWEPLGKRDGYIERNIRPNIEKTERGAFTPTDTRRRRNHH
jgi:hypothetical protein